MAKSFIDGHPVYYERETRTWKWCDTGEPVEASRPCPKCEKLSVNGHDDCLKNLPGVKAACCGHGKETGYILFNDGTMIQGHFSINRKWDLHS